MLDRVDRQTVLVVDDEPVNIRLLQILLEQDYRVLAATNGHKALEIVSSESQPDLILLDVMMPELDGYSVLEELKRNPKTTDITVIFVTAKLTEEDENKGLALGAIDYISKPVNSTAVKIKVDAHLNAIRQRKFIDSLISDQTDTISRINQDSLYDRSAHERLIKQHLETIRIEKERLQLALWASETELWDANLKSGDIERSAGASRYKLPSGGAEELLKSCEHYIHPKDFAQFKQSMEKHLNGTVEFFDAEYRVRSEQNQWVWIHDRGKLIKSARDNQPIRMVGTLRDISKRKQREKEKRIIKQAVQIASDGVWIADSELKLEAVNKSFTRITGMTSDEVIGICLHQLGLAGQDNASFDRIKTELRRKGSWTGELAALDKTRRYIQELRIDRIFSEEDETTHYIGIFRDITQRKRQQEEMTRLANYDQLTGLANRTLFNERLHLAIQGQRNGNGKFALLFIDLDNFKRVNDSLGHDAGDQLLISIAQRITSIMRIQDLVARFGGDEFVLMLEQVEGAHSTARIAHRLIQSIAQPLELNGHEVIISASIGIAIFPDDGRDSEELLKNADIAMYVAKQDGKSSYRFYSVAMNSNALERLGLESALRLAIERDEVEVYFQPKVNLQVGNIDGLEVLARWQHNGQFISPQIFVGIAEEAGLIHALGDHLMRKACFQYKQWLDQGIAKGRVAFNLSSQQFSDNNLLSNVESVLADTGLSAKYLELEITETMVMENTLNAIEKMHALRDLGISLAIDDFGTGYSSLTYLKEFPVNTLKIDRCFIKDMLSSQRNRNIVRLIVDMAHSLNLGVVAEGVETNEQAEQIKNLNAEEMQGFLFSKPLPVNECEKLLKLNPKWPETNGN